MRGHSGCGKTSCRAEAGPSCRGGRESPSRGWQGPAMFSKPTLDTEEPRRRHSVRNETKVERPGFSLNCLCDLRQMATPLWGCVLRASEMQGRDLSWASVGIVFELGTLLLKQGPGRGGQFGRSGEEAKITPHCALRISSVPSCPTSTRVGIRGNPSLPCPTKAARSDFILVSYMVSIPSGLICKRGSERPHFSET